LAEHVDEREEGSPKWTIWCHCQSCHKHSGAQAWAFAAFDETAVEVTKGEITKFGHRRAPTAWRRAAQVRPTLGEGCPERRPGMTVDVQRRILAGLAKFDGTTIKYLYLCWHSTLRRTSSRLVLISERTALTSSQPLHYGGKKAESRAFL
jgi:hypothetical protein